MQLLNDECGCSQIENMTAKTCQKFGQMINRRCWV